MLLRLSRSALGNRLAVCTWLRLVEVLVSHCAKLTASSKHATLQLSWSIPCPGLPLQARYREEGGRDRSRSPVRR